MKYFYCVLLLLCSFLNSNSQVVTLDTKIAKAKLTEKDRLLKNISKTLQLPITDSTYTHYQSAFWAMMLLEHKPKEAFPKLKIALKNFSKYDNSFQNALLEMVYSQYPKTFEKEIFSLLKDTSITAKQFAVCGEYLLNISIKNKFSISSLIKKRYEYTFNEIINALEIKINHSPNNYWFKEVIKSLVNNKFLNGKNVVLSLQNKNRNYPGITIIKDSIGHIIKNNDTFFMCNN